MKIRYYAETDSLYIELLPQPGTDVAVVGDHIRIDTDAKGRAVGIDIDNASKYYDVNNLEASGIPAIRVLASSRPAAGTQ
ncbi:MAG: DUF2283 domain-containing protein [Alphaproteobacteria bacterium]|nr:DUF2283 domain-containing protein [Alphaproteobacteria bacterium]